MASDGSLILRGKGLEAWRYRFGALQKDANDLHEWLSSLV